MNYVDAAPGHRRRRRAPPRRHRRHVAAVRPAAARWPSPTPRSSTAAPRCARPGASRPPRRSTPSGPPSRSPRTRWPSAVAELRPGVSERELTGVFMDAMASHGITTPATQDVVRITSPGAPAGPPATGAGAGRRPRRRSTPASSPTATPARWAAPGPSTSTATPPPSTTSTAAPTSCGTGCSTRAGPAHPPPACSTPTAAAGEPLPATPVARGLGLGFDDPVIVRDLPRDRGDGDARPRRRPRRHRRASPTTPSASVVTHEAILITADGPEVLTSSPFWNPDAAGAP